MTDDSTGRQSALETDPFQTWVESLSKSKGASREEVLEQLISSYWTLHELLQVIEESGDDVDLYPSAGETDALPGDGRAPTVGLAEADDAAGAAGRLDERLDALADESEERWAALASRHDDLEARVDDEFDNLRTVLEYLIDATDGLAERTDALIEEHARTTRRRRAEREALVALKREAGSHGVTEAVCDHCETAVAVGTLATPRCPQCESTFDGVVPRTGWLEFGSSRLTVSDDPDPFAPAGDSPLDEGSLADDFGDSRPDGGTVEPTAPPDRFEWLDADDLR